MARVKGAMIELYIELEDESLDEELVEMSETLKEKVEELRLTTLLTGEYDANNAIITLHAGAGGLLADLAGVVAVISICYLFFH